MFSIVCPIPPHPSITMPWILWLRFCPPLYFNWSLLILRVVLGAIFLAHGWPKIKNIKTVGGNFSAMGFWLGAFWGPVVALVEFFGGLALIAGFYTQAAAALFVGEFVVINIWKFSKRQPFIGNRELDLLIFGAISVLLTFGAGAFSLDRYFFLMGF